MKSSGAMRDSGSTTRQEGAWIEGRGATDLGELGGIHAKSSAVELAVAATRAALVGMNATSVQAVIVATGYHSHDAASIARAALGEDRPILSVISGGAAPGLEALARGARAVLRDGFERVLVLGVDHATHARHLLDASVQGGRLGHGKLLSQVRPLDAHRADGASCELRPGDGALAFIFGRRPAAEPRRVAAFCWAANESGALAGLDAWENRVERIDPSLPSSPGLLGLAESFRALDAWSMSGNRAEVVIARPRIAGAALFVETAET